MILIVKKMHLELSEERPTWRDNTRNVLPFAYDDGSCNETNTNRQNLELGPHNDATTLSLLVVQMIYEYAPCPCFILCRLQLATQQELYCSSFVSLTDRPWWGVAQKLLPVLVEPLGYRLRPFVAVRVLVRVVFANQVLHKFVPVLLVFVLRFFLVIRLCRLSIGNFPYIYMLYKRAFRMKKFSFIRPIQHDKWEHAVSWRNLSCIL